MELRKPITESGEPTLYACIIMALADGRLYTKEQILSKIFTSEKLKEILIGGYLSKTFSILKKHNIITSRNGRYIQADKYDAYMGFILREMYCHPVHNSKFGYMFKRYSINSMDFVMK
jgi:hypothetical protein